jgi:hypothetical protein
MSPRADDRAQRVLLVWLCIAIVTTTIGFLTALRLVAAVGLGAYAVGLIVLLALLPVMGAKQLRWAGPRLLQLGAGFAWWTAATVAVAFQTMRGDAVFTRPVLGVLVVGGFAQILAAALAYLAPVLRGGGHVRLSAGFAITRSWLGLIVANVAALALAFGAHGVAVLAIGAWLVDGAVRSVVLVRPRVSQPAS